MASLAAAAEKCAKLGGVVPRAQILKSLGTTAPEFQKLVDEATAKMSPPSTSKIWTPERGVTASVFGGTGFLGKYVAQSLALMNARAYIANRACEFEVRHLQPLFDQNCLGQVGFPQYSPRDEDSIKRAMEKSNIVINMIGKYYQPKHAVPIRKVGGKASRVTYTFEEQHVEVPARLARLAREAGVQRFVHVSALASDRGSDSAWARTKAEGEEAVRAEFPGAVIVRPSVLYGPEDRFLNWFATAAEKYPFVPLVDGGAPLVQPVYVVDVAKAIGQTVREDQWDGKTLDLAGDDDYTWKEVAEFVYDITGQDVRLVNLPSDAAKLLGRFAQELPHPVWTEDIAVQQAVDNVLDPATPNVTFAELGLQPERMERVAFHWLHRFRAGGHFLNAEGYHN